MSFLHTTTLLELVKARLEALPLDPAQPGQALSQRVGYFGAKQLGEALEATFAAEDRVCFIVPAGYAHRSTRERTMIVSERTTGLVLLLADRALDRTRQAALVGGSPAIGVLELVDRVIDDFFATPFEQADLALVPGDGDLLMLEKGKGQNLGRECWMQHFTAYTGSARAAIP